MPMTSSSDSVLRAITDDGSFRVIAARTTETVRGVLRAQSARGPTARWLGDLVTGTILLRETMAPRWRVQGILLAPGGRGRLIADSHPDGGARGLIQPAANGEPLSLGEGALLQLIRTLPSGAVHQGVVAVPPAGGLSAALMNYLQTSEQVVSMIAVGCVMNHDELVAAGGYLIQLLPELTHEPLTIMTARVEHFQTIEPLLENPDTTPESMLAALLEGLPFTKLSSSALSFRCRCSDARLMAALAMLPRHDIEEIVHDGTPLDITCDYCNRRFEVLPERLRGLLKTS